MGIYEAKVKGALNNRVKSSLNQAGFRWDGVTWLMEAERPPKVWGCKVGRYRPPRCPRGDMLAVAFGIIGGTHDEFGRPISHKG